jgi:hypothetical protein
MIPVASSRACLFLFRSWPGLGGANEGQEQAVRSQLDNGATDCEHLAKREPAIPRCVASSAHLSRLVRFGNLE